MSVVRRLRDAKRGVQEIYFLTVGQGEEIVGCPDDESDRRVRDADVEGAKREKDDRYTMMAC